MDVPGGTRISIVKPLWRASGKSRSELSQVRPFQAVTRQAPFLADLGPHTRDLSPAAGKAPAFDEKYFAARFPLGWQIERKGEIAVRCLAL